MCTSPQINIAQCSIKIEKGEPNVNVKYKQCAHSEELLLVNCNGWIHPSKEGTVSTMGFRMEAPKLFVLSGDHPWTGSGFSTVSLKGISSVRDRVLNLSPICKPEQLLKLGTVHH